MKGNTLQTNNINVHDIKPPLPPPCSITPPGTIKQGSPFPRVLFTGTDPRTGDGRTGGGECYDVNYYRDDMTNI